MSEMEKLQRKIEVLKLIDSLEAQIGEFDRKALIVLHGLLEAHKGLEARLTDLEDRVTENGG